MDKFCSEGGVVLKNVTNDHRTRVTRMMIRRAFTDLLNHKPIQSISIRELCASAGINRGTFYAHYTDIYDLQEQIESEMLEDFILAMQPLLESQNEDFNPVEISTQIFQCLKDNSDVCTMTLGDFGDKDFAFKLINIGREKCMSAYTQYFKTASQNQIEYFYYFASAGCIGILKKWLADGMIAPAGEIAAMAEAIMMRGVGFLKQEEKM